MLAAFKKWTVSIFVVASFIGYSYHSRRELSAPVVPPASTPTTTTDNGATTPSQTPPKTTPQPAATTGRYKDGSFTGQPADAYYGLIQVRVIISGGKIVDVVFLQYPNDRENSIRINTAAMPYLKQEAIAAQSANVDIVSGATESSMAFQQSLASALGQATP